jgi:signal transduction histidine kinase
VGLGLAIVDAIAKRHGGACNVESTFRGTVFSLVLPSALSRNRFESVPLAEAPAG